MSNPILSAHAATNGVLARAGAATVTPLPFVNGAKAVALRARKVESPALHRLESPMFLDTAHTVLPIEFQGKEIVLEAHAYEDESVSYQAMALVHRDEAHKVNGRHEAPLVRVHSGCVTGDIFHSLRCDCYQQLQKALERVTTSQHGIIIYLPHHEGRGIGLVNKIKAYGLQDRGFDTIEANEQLGFHDDEREYREAAEMLRRLGFHQVRLMTNNPRKLEALGRHGVAVVERVPHSFPANDHNQRYLWTKANRSGHMF